MLQAIVRRKPLGQLKRSSPLGAQEIFSEDAITAAVFEPLQYMPTEAAWNIVRAILLRNIDHYIQDSVAPVSHELLFWPMRSVPRDTVQRSEPDLVFKFRDDKNDVLLLLILEVKWNASLSNDQLVKQRDAFHGEIGNGHLHQVLLARPPTVFSVSTKTQLDVDRNCISAVTWEQVSDILNRSERLDTSLPPVRIWAENIGKFFLELGLIPFDRLDSLPYRINETVTRPVMNWYLDSWAFEESSKSSVSAEALWTVNQWRLAS